MLVQRRFFVLAVAAALCGFMGEPVSATRHFIQIEQIIGGVNGDTTVQAVQLRLRASEQTELSDMHVRVWDAKGENPIDVVIFPSDISNGDAGARVLIASPFGSCNRPETKRTGLLCHESCGSLVHHGVTVPAR